MSGCNIDIRSVIVGRMSGTTIEMPTTDGRVVRVRKESPPDRRARLFDLVFSGPPMQALRQCAGVAEEG
jgi:hypothetical protein